MKKQIRNSRKRTLCVVGVLCPGVNIIGSTSFPQHIVRPARRIVQYNNNVLLQQSTTNMQEEEVEVEDFCNDDDAMACDTEFNNHRRILLLETTFNRSEAFWHVASVNSHYLNDDDDVDKVFEQLRQLNNTFQTSNGLQQSVEYKHVPKKAQPHTSSSSIKQRFFSSLYRKLQLFGSNVTQEDHPSSFVDNSEKFPVDNETTISANATTSSSVGFNVNSETQYNVSATIIYDVSDESSSTTVTTANDTSTVIFTVAKPRNDTYVTGNDNTENNDHALNESRVDGDNNILDHDNSTTIGGGTNTNNNTNQGPADDDDDDDDVEDTKFRPIRLRAFLSEVASGGEHLTVQQRYLLLQRMVRPAMLTWSAALRVIPVQGPLTVDPFQLRDGLTCGPDDDDLPSVAVPLQHTTDGIWNTDMVIYIGLAFTSNVTTTTNGTVVSAGDDHSSAAVFRNTTYMANASQDLETMRTNNNTSNNNGGDGYKLEKEQNEMEKLEDKLLENRNITVRVKQKCAGDYMAASTFCSTDQYDRPTAALLHICIDETFFDEANLATNIRVIMHELGHALGFNAVSMAHFRRPDGSPVTERTSTGTVPLIEINCTGPETQTSQRRGVVPLPSTEIVQFRTVRNGIRVAEIVTPSVAQVVRNHFDCQVLPGAELESGEFLPLSTNPGEVSCLGDHWERRLFQSDLMNPLVDTETGAFNPHFSTLTLAYFADSGWYQADLSRAEYPSIWGRGAGCEFVEQPCVSENGTVFPSYEQFFCTQKPGGEIDDEYASVIQGCTADLSRKASCSLGKYDGELPQEYQYFKNNYGADFGGNDPFMDYCPVYSGFVNGLCSDSENEALIRVNVLERFGNRNSRCLSSRIERATGLALPANSSNSTELTGLCMPIACVVEDRSLRIQVDGKWKICTQKDETIAATIGNDVVSVICPDPIRICPTFYCQRDCLGRADGRTVCDYNGGDCVCANMTIAINDTDVCVPILATSADNSSSVNGTEEDHSVGKPSQTDRLFYDSNKNKSQLPDPDSPLADYYVPTARTLSDEPVGLLKKLWIFFMAGGFAVVVIMLLSYFWIRKRRLHTSINGLSSGPDDQGGEETAFNPDKHKMMANVVVHLRMNDVTLQRRIQQQDALRDRASETDLSMTDTEGTSACVANDLSSEGVPASTQSEIEDISDDGSNQNGSLHLTDNDVQNASSYGIDPLAQPSQSQPTVVRRRHIPMLGNGWRK